MSRCLVAFLNDLPQPAKQKLDLIFRLSFLEGVARKDAGEWTRRPSQGAVAARSFFEAQGIQVDPQWFTMNQKTPWVTELDRRAYVMAQRFRKSLDAISISQDDIVNSLVAATNSPTGRRQDKVFYSFGLSWKDPGQLATTEPAGSVIGAGLTRAIAQHIKDALARAGNRPHLLGPTNQQVNDSRDMSREQQLDNLMVNVLDENKSSDTLLIDMMGHESGLSGSILQLAESAIDRVTKDEVARFALRRFFAYLVDPSFNVFTSTSRDKRPNQSKMWAMLKNIREQVRVDMLKQFDPDGTMGDEEKTRFLRRLYGILGSGGRGSGGNADLPEGIEKVLAEIRKAPAVSKLLQEFAEERERMNLRSMTAGVVRAFRVRQARANLGLLGMLLEQPNLLA